MLGASALDSRGYELLGTGKQVADWEACEESVRQIELIAGELWIAPRPSELHQRVQWEISHILSTWIKRNDLGRLYLPPVGLLTQNGDVFEPDLTFVEKSHPQHAGGWTLLDRPPSLVVEIVSPGSRKRDWMIKRDGYAAMGVPNYWVVETQERTIWGFALSGSAYEEVVQGSQDAFEAPPFVGLTIPLSLLADR